VGLGHLASQPLRDDNSVYGVLEGTVDGEDHGIGSELCQMTEPSGRGIVS
jgi:hypothetical protein